MKKKWDSMSFQDAKKMDLDMISKKQNMFNEMRSCIDNASTKTQLEGCHDKMRNKNQEMKSMMDKKMEDKTKQQM